MAVVTSEQEIAAYMTFPGLSAVRTTTDAYEWNQPVAGSMLAQAGITHFFFAAYVGTLYLPTEPPAPPPDQEIKAPTSIEEAIRILVPGTTSVVIIDDASTRPDAAWTALPVDGPSILATVQGYAVERYGGIVYVLVGDATAPDLEIEPEPWPPEGVEIVEGALMADAPEAQPQSNAPDALVLDSVDTAPDDA